MTWPSQRFDSTGRGDVPWLNPQIEFFDETPLYEHGLTHHGAKFYTDLAHQGEHTQSDEAVKALRDGHGAWLGHLMPVAHDYEPLADHRTLPRGDGTGGTDAAAT